MMKLEDMCLTIQQAQELFNLGIALDGVMGIFVAEGKKYIEPISLGLHKNYMPTLTNSEMLEKLPRYIEVADGMAMRRLSYLSVDKNSVCYAVNGTYPDDGFIVKSFYGKLLRDSLFEMIKFLKSKKRM